MNHKPNEVKKYLTKFASNQWQLESNSIDKIKNVIVVPAISEYKNILSLLSSLSNNCNDYFETTVIIFVINNSENADTEVKANNAKTLQLIRNLIKHKSVDLSRYNKIISSGLRLGLIDASSEGKELPEKQSGVGFARKIGMDTALNIFDYSSTNKKVIISLDADCKVEKNYMNEIINSFNEKNLHAGILNYQHKINNKTTAPAIICYETFLRYFTLALKYAGSPFAFHSIGSTIAVDYETYIKVGGMNKRKAGEDFYFLEKIAKVAQINRINNTTVFPSSRKSWRVPFGTGQRVKRFLSNEQNEYLLYNPKSFYLLKNWLDHFNNKIFYSSKDYLREAKKINQHLFEFLKINNFESDWDKIVNNSKDKTQLYKQKINWFDGFRTLKLIHYLRDNAFPVVDMFDALDEILMWYEIKIKRNKNDKIPNLSKQIEYLEILRKLDA